MLFQHGELAESQRLAAKYAKRFARTEPQWASKFAVLEAQSAAWRGRYEDVVQILQPALSSNTDLDSGVQRHVLLGLAYFYLQLPQANDELDQAQNMCADADLAACGSLLRARGNLAVERGHPQEAYKLFLRSLAVARRFHRQLDESSSLMDLGTAYLQEERLDEAINWFHKASEVASALNARDAELYDLGNEGWAYYKLGDMDTALRMLKSAEEDAISVGDSEGAIQWLTTIGIVDQHDSNPDGATEANLQALALAKQINSKADVINALENLAHVSIQAGQFDQAKKYVDQVTPLLDANKNRLDELDVMLAQGQIDAASREDSEAEEIFRTVEHDPMSWTSMKLVAEQQLARLYEAQGNSAKAEGMYRTALTTFEGAREQLKNEASKLPFLANATDIYDDYIHFLVAQGKTGAALVTADQSRARTLAQGLGIVSKQAHLHPAALDPRAVAHKVGAMMLFYWLGSKQSYLWAITPQRTTLFTLPAQERIAPLIERYRRTLLSVGDPLESGNNAGQELYAMLVAPAATLLRPGVPVMILADGALSRLNFETLVVPGAKAGAMPHYWIEDATLMAAPSLAMLAAARPEHRSASAGQEQLLLLGNPVSPGPDYPELPFAAVEMREIEKHFRAQDEVVFTRQAATSRAYLISKPERFSYIHFVSHGVASSTDPLDSAIILSRTVSGTGAAGPGDSFKLYARDVMQHPIDARLVTISACYGSGTRAYAGEGLVGLSWAFLRAGAHSAVGAMWETSDSSSPRLMNAFYQGLQDGQSPAAALRQAKLGLLHSRESFRKPFYWGAFQLYTRI